jgi:hypothetical protein
MTAPMIKVIGDQACGVRTGRSTSCELSANLGASSIATAALICSNA